LSVDEWIPTNRVQRSGDDVSKTYRYRVVDVFTTQALEGNPLAVFTDPGSLDAAMMQKIARELSLSETVFVCPATRRDCVARLRIFTPRREVDFAGHPTVGASFVLIDDGIVSKTQPRFALEENVGPVPIVVDGEIRPLIWLTTPPIRQGPHIERTAAARLLSLPIEQLLEAPPQILDAGNPTLFVALRDCDAVDRASLDSAAWTSFKVLHAAPMCVFAFAPTRDGAYSRMFAPDYGIAEDPATGSSTGPLAWFMLRHGLAPSASSRRFQSEQGTQMGRRSILHVKVNGNDVSDGIAVGGHVIPVIDGVLTL
jgi:trans-2,3-dihydro-3-hydroxyanthranilate isomerase